MEQNTTNILNTALKAFEYFSHGWLTGNFDDYISMLDEDFTFHFPEGKHAGEFYGQEGKRHMIEKCLDHTSVGERLNLHKPYKVTANDTTAIIEFKAEGYLNNKYYLGNIAISFDIKSDKVCGFREYYGFSS